MKLAESKALLIVEYLPFIFISLMVGFSQFINHKILLIGLLFTSIIFFYQRKKCIVFKKNKIYKLWLLCIIFMYISVLYSPYKNDSIKFTTVYLFFITLSYFFSLNNSWVDKLNKVVVAILFIHVLYTIYSFLFFDSSQNICNMVFSKDFCNLNFRWATENFSYSGISGQLGTNATIMTVLSSIIFAKFSMKNKKKLNLIMFILTWIAMFLSGKDSFIFANILAMVIIGFIYIFSRNKHIAINILKILSLLIAIVAVLLVINLNILENYYATSIISRFNIYEVVFGKFLESPIIGNGINTAAFLTEHLAHNIYLQLLCEIGIIGTALVCYPLFYTLIVSIKAMIRKFKHLKCTLNNKDISILIQGVYFQLFFLINGITGNTLFDYSIFLIYILFVAACVPIIFKEKEQRI